MLYWWKHVDKMFGDHWFNLSWSFYWWQEGPFRFNSLWDSVFEKHPQLFSFNSPSKAECISCPRKSVCAHLCWAANVLAQKTQDAVNGPLGAMPRTVKHGTALSLQIILIPCIASHCRVHKSISKVISYVSTRQVNSFLFYMWEKRFRKAHGLSRGHPARMWQVYGQNYVLLTRTAGLFALITKCKCAPWVPGRIRWQCVRGPV